MPNLTGSFLVIDFEIEPHPYMGVLIFDVTVVMRDRCDAEAPPLRFTAPFPSWSNSTGGRTPIRAVK